MKNTYTHNSIISNSTWPTSSASEAPLCLYWKENIARLIKSRMHHAAAHSFPEHEEA